MPKKILPLLLLGGSALVIALAAFESKASPSPPPAPGPLPTPAPDGTNTLPVAPPLVLTLIGDQVANGVASALIHSAHTVRQGAAVAPDDGSDVVVAFGPSLLAGLPALDGPNRTAGLSHAVDDVVKALGPFALGLATHGGRALVILPTTQVNGRTGTDTAAMLKLLVGPSDVLSAILKNPQLDWFSSDDYAKPLPDGTFDATGYAQIATEVLAALRPPPVAVSTLSGHASSVKPGAVAHGTMQQETPAFVPGT